MVIDSQSSNKVTEMEMGQSYLLLEVKWTRRVGFFACGMAILLHSEMGKVWPGLAWTETAKPIFETFQRERASS